MAADGIFLTSPTAMARAWPDVWANEKAARDSLQDRDGAARVLAAWGGQNDKTLIGISIREMSICVPFSTWEYRLAGDKQKTKHLTCDVLAIPDPAAWLATRLGPLAFCRRLAPARREIKLQRPEGGRATLEYLLAGNVAVLGRVAYSERRAGRQ
jgi:hypothetical protein